MHSRNDDNMLTHFFLFQRPHKIAKQITICNKLRFSDSHIRLMRNPYYVHVTFTFNANILLLPRLFISLATLEISISIVVDFKIKVWLNAQTQVVDLVVYNPHIPKFESPPPLPLTLNLKHRDYMSLDERKMYG